MHDNQKNARYKRVLLTGGSGFLGNIILSRLLVSYNCDIILLLRTGVNVNSLLNNAKEYINNNGTPISDTEWDSFDNMFFAAIEILPVNSHINIVSDLDSLPSCRDIVDLWFKRVLKPKSVSYYDNYASLPLSALSRKERMFFNLIKTNTHIATASWVFETSANQKIKEQGIKINTVTLESLLRCQDSFVRQSVLLA